MNKQSLSNDQLTAHVFGMVDIAIDNMIKKNYIIRNNFTKSLMDKLSSDQKYLFDVLNDVDNTTINTNIEEKHLTDKSRNLIRLDSKLLAFCYDIDRLNTLTNGTIRLVLVKAFCWNNERYVFHTLNTRNLGYLDSFLFNRDIDTDEVTNLIKAQYAQLLEYHIACL